MAETAWRRLVLGGGAALIAITALGAIGATRVENRERPFLAENQRAMDTMRAGMTPKPIGDVDADFASLLIPHHQGAIDMAILELQYGHNEQLRRIAQEIIVDQQQEIAAMRLALGETVKDI